VQRAHEALRSGAWIVTDTTMALSGINKKSLQKAGGEAHCFIGDEDVAEEAKRLGVTRASVCVDKASRLNRPVIYVVGNAPTALIRLYELIQQGTFRPELIIGVPVGFVNVVQSKELIMQTDVPYIVARGRKGGSNVAASICNALLYQLDGSRK
jgi:precorrin-8X/cobalt-precorrin-8 methylmutase